MDETTPNDGSLQHAASLFASVFSADSPSVEDQHTSDSKPEQSSSETTEQASAAPETKSASEQTTTEEGENAPAPETPTTYKAKIDGQEVEVTLEEALKGYSRTQDYTRKTQELAAQRKEFEEKELNAVRQERQQYGEYLAKWVDVLKANTPTEPNPEAMEPSVFAVEWVKWKQHKDHVEQAQAEQARVKAVQDADADRGFQQYVRSEQGKLSEAIPAFASPETSEPLKRDLIAYAKTRGFSEEDFGAVTDHRLVVLLHDAMQGHKAKAKAPEIKQRVEKVLESPKPGANVTAAKPDSKREAMKRLRETGSVRDAANAFAAVFDT